MVFIFLLTQQIPGWRLARVPTLRDQHFSEKMFRAYFGYARSECQSEYPSDGNELTGLLCWTPKHHPLAFGLADAFDGACAVC